VKPKHQRLVFLLVSVGIMSVAATIILSTFRENLVFFFTPTQLHEKITDPAFDTTREARLGGLVETGSIEHLDDGGLRFTVTDLTKTMRVEYHGLLPTLFREGQGVVATGILKNDIFMAREILAKHDENYMPKEVAEALKESGQWKPE